MFFKSAAHLLHQAGSNVHFLLPSHQGTELEGAVHCSGDIVPKVGQALSSVVSLQEGAVGRSGQAGLSCGIKLFGSLNHPVYLEEAAAKSSNKSCLCHFSGLAQGRCSGCSHISLMGDRQRYTPGRLNSATAIWVSCYCRD